MEVLVKASVELDLQALLGGDRAQAAHTGLVYPAVQAVVLVGSSVEHHAIAAPGDFDRSVNTHMRRVTVDEIAPQVLVEVRRQGDVPLFEAMYAKLTGLRPKLVSRIVYEPGGEALAVACKAVGIDKPNFASLFMLTRKAHAKDKVISPRELTPVLEFFDNIKLESATLLLERWRRDPDYLDSIRALESPEGKDDKN